MRIICGDLVWIIVVFDAYKSNTTVTERFLKDKVTYTTHLTTISLIHETRDFA